MYKSDWTDGVNRKSLPAIMFLYFACLLPAVAFGGIATQVGVIFAVLFLVVPDVAEILSRLLL